MNTETRIAPAPSLVQKTKTTAVLRGYAALFGSVYNMGWFSEEIHRDAFKNADMSDVRVLFNHNVDLLLGRTSSGTARVWVDAKGLAFEVELPRSPNGKNVRIAAERGDIRESSWGFMISPDSDDWTNTGKKPHRIIRSIAQVFDVSPVTFPANPAATAKLSEGAKRSFDAAQATTDAQVENLLAQIAQERQAIKRQRAGLQIDVQAALLAADIQRTKFKYSTYGKGY